MAPLPEDIGSKPDPSLLQVARVSRTGTALGRMQPVLWVLAWLGVGLFASTQFEGLGYQALAVIWCIAFAICTLIYFNRSRRKGRGKRFMQ
jgi:hypothetical protein